MQWLLLGSFNNGIRCLDVSGRCAGLPPSPAVPTVNSKIFPLALCCGGSSSKPIPDHETRQSLVVERACSAETSKRIQCQTYSAALLLVAQSCEHEHGENHFAHDYSEKEKIGYFLIY